MRAGMQWSKLKARVKERICPELRDRVDFHLTSYRRSHDDVDKVWITIDGETIFKAKHYAYAKASAEAFYCGLSGAAIKSMLSIPQTSAMRCGAISTSRSLRPSCPPTRSSKHSRSSIAVSVSGRCSN